MKNTRVDSTLDGWVVHLRGLTTLTNEGRGCRREDYEDAERVDLRVF